MNGRYFVYFQGCISISTTLTKKGNWRYFYNGRERAISDGKLFISNNCKEKMYHFSVKNLMFLLHIFYFLLQTSCFLHDPVISMNLVCLKPGTFTCVVRYTVLMALSRTYTHAWLLSLPLFFLGMKLKSWQLWSKARDLSGVRMGPLLKIYKKTNTNNQTC